MYSSGLTLLLALQTTAVLLSSCCLAASTAVGKQATTISDTPVGRSSVQESDSLLDNTSDDYAEGQVAAAASSDALPLPPQCAVTAGNTTNDCQGTCLTCEDTGLVANRRPCKCCKPGSYLSDPDAVKCYKCPIGKYASAPGARVCIDCPKGLTTLRLGSKSCNGELAVPLSRFS